MGAALVVAVPPMQRVLAHVLGLHKPNRRAQLVNRSPDGYDQVNGGDGAEVC